MLVTFGIERVKLAENLLISQAASFSFFSPQAMLREGRLAAAV